jgi:3',5'-cyclic AMP phosphodiesterase CpdA
MRDMDLLNRREFVTLGAVAAGAALLPQSAAAEPPGSFDYLFLTDTHIQPELAAADGCALAFKKASTIRADFAIQGGDHVFDAMAVPRQRAESLFDLYSHTEQALGIKVYHTIGNHDQFGVLIGSGVELAAPSYGKQMFIDRVGPTYYSFDHKGYHFITLDSVQPTGDRSWDARIDEPQLKWLADDLAKTAPTTPIVVTCHVPLVTAFSQYTPPGGAGGSGVATKSASLSAGLPAVHPQLAVVNAWQVLPLFLNHNLLAVLQGHTHINEVVEFHGVQFITSGAVCGNWWHGTRLGTPEGFTVVSLRNGKLTHRYETYGFKSVAPQNT